MDLRRALMIAIERLSNRGNYFWLAVYGAFSVTRVSYTVNFFSSGRSQKLKR